MKNRKVAYLSFDGIHDPIQDELIAAATSVIKSKWYILGENVKNFEDNFANYLGMPYAIGVNSGLDGLVIALRTLNIGPGDEVILASNTYIACLNAVQAVGAKIVLVEPSEETFNLDPSKIEDSITENTKVIMAVHLYGRICQMNDLVAIAKKHKLFIVEDNAQAQGAEFKGQKSGSFGHINSTSFYPGKNLGALGDAGIITTSDINMANMATSLRNYGSTKKYHNEHIGLNSRLDEIQAALLTVKLKYLVKWNKERLEIAQKYSNLLAGISGIQLPEIPDDGSHVCHIYAIRTKERDKLKGFLSTQGIETLIHYPVPPHLQKAYAFLDYKEGDFPIAEEMAATCLSLPIYPGLLDKEIRFICEQIKQFSVQILK